MRSLILVRNEADISPGGYTRAAFYDHVLHLGFPIAASSSWPTDAVEFPDALIASLSQVHRGRDLGGTRVLCGARDRSACWAQIHQGDVFAFLYGADETAVRALEQHLLTHLPRRIRIPHDTTIAVRFWMLGPHGPESVTRRVKATRWDEVTHNYPSRTRGGLDRLMALTAPDRSGQLLLWHGEAGTGKTWALRALAQAWQDWCDVEYVIDPDQMFSDHPAYLAKVLLETGSVPVMPAGNDPLLLRWRLLILEDTAELLTMDAGERTGQGLARLLNTTDGLLGQGLRILVLLTTNEPIAKLHPALIRPGRCLANVAFERLDPAETQAWLIRHGLLHLGSTLRTATLAELYASLNGHVPEPRREIGMRVKV